MLNVRYDSEIYFYFQKLILNRKFFKVLNYVIIKFTMDVCDYVLKVIQDVICCKNIPNHTHGVSRGTLDFSDHESYSSSHSSQVSVDMISVKDSLQYSRIEKKVSPETQETQRATQIIFTDDCLVSLDKDIQQIWDAVDNNQIQLISEFISTNDVSLLEDFDGLTLLHRSVIAGNKEMTETLIGKIDISAKDHIGRTPLHYACMRSDAEIITLLLKSAGDPFVTDKFGKIPADYCAANQQIRSIFSTIRNNSSNSLSIDQDYPSNSSSKNLKRKINSQNIESQNERRSVQVPHGTVSKGHQKVRRLTGPVEKSSYSSYLQDFEVVNVLGVSSLGIVYLVRDIKASFEYAMKVISKSVLKEDYERRMVETEKKLMILFNHPFINSLIYSFQTKHKLIVITQFCSGGSLSSQSLEKGNMSSDEIRLYSSEIIEALDYIHERGVVYRALSLKNILLSADGHIKLSNFQMASEGISEDSYPALFHRQTSLPPEMMAANEFHGKEVDWYMLGLVIYELATSSRYQSSLSNIQDTVLKDLLTHLLNPVHYKRLGFSSTLEIKSHPFFSSTDWEAVRSCSQKMPAPVGIDTFPQFTDLDLSVNEEYTSDKPFPNWTFIYD